MIPFETSTALSLGGDRWERRNKSDHSLFEKNSEELQSAGGLLDRFADDDVRYIARDTAVYDRLRQACQHPDRLRNALDRDQLLDGLWVGAAQQSYLIRLISSELRDLQSGDIPAVHFPAELPPSMEQSWERISDVFERPPIEMVRDALTDLGDRDLSRQVQLIRTSMASRAKRDSPPTLP
jgi:lantibiotic modifying enzyme